MRFEGTIKSWNDDRGFGFIESVQGGQEIFVHIKAFGGSHGRPQPAQRVSFQVEVGPQGKKRAVHVELLRARPQPAVRAQREGPAPWGAASLWAFPCCWPCFLRASCSVSRHCGPCGSTSH
ncbi:cold shock domain-containing protein [Pantoea sp. 18069]|uniref:cold-shock protein n=1 Tax=Pantoea sp. 18069 TaxID=2681415 RepID=UPI00190FB52C